MSLSEPLTDPARRFLARNPQARCWNPARGLGGCGGPSLEQAVLHPCRWRLCPGHLEIGTRAVDQIRTLARWAGVTVDLDPNDFSMSEPLTLEIAMAAEQRFAEQERTANDGLKLYHFADHEGTAVAIFERYDGAALRLNRMDYLCGMMSAKVYPTAEAAAAGEGAEGYRYRGAAHNSKLDTVLYWFLSHVSQTSELADYLRVAP